LGLCEETKVLKLENRILSLIDKRDKQGEKFDSKAYWDAIDEIDTLSQEEATTLLVRLFDYYLGEGTDELLLEKVTQMGDKILPYLVQKRNVPRMTCRNEYKEMCHTIQERNYLIDEAIKGIKDGIVLCYEHPEKLKKEAEQYLPIIQIFIEDYKKQKGALPKNLQELQEYGWIRYRYKIKIINGWGNPYKYVVQKNKYKVEIGEMP